VSKTFHRQPQLAKRYACDVRTIQRMRRDGRLPPPDLYIPFPLWSDETLEANERSAALRAPPSKTISNEPDPAS
jgi:hypothetical protein